MAGLLTHLIISSVLFIIVLVISRRFLYGFFIFIGQLIPDAIKFGVTGIKLWTASPNLIIRDSLFWKLEALTSSYHTWVNLGLLIILTSLFLYSQNKLKKEHVKEISWSYLLLVIGVVIHLVIDLFIIEKSYWI